MLGLENKIVRAQLLAQTVNVSSWLFLKSSHNIHTALPLSPHVQNANLWAFHRGLRLSFGESAFTLLEKKALSPCVNVSFGAFFPQSLTGVTTLLASLKFNLVWFKVFISFNPHAASWLSNLSGHSVTSLVVTSSIPASLEAWL